MKIGLALSGGVARGIAHIGVLRCLEENDIRPHCICGTSAGSIIAALYCAGMSLDKLEEIATTLKWKDLASLTLPRTGLVDSERLEQFLTSIIGSITFSELKIPLQVTAVDLFTGSEVIIYEGNVARAVRASCAIPGIFTPVKCGDKLLVDGGLLNNVPTRPLKKQCLDFIIAVDVNAQQPLMKEPFNIFNVLLQSFHIVQRGLDLQSHQFADLLIEPDLGDLAVWDMGGARVFMERGYEACCEKLRQVRIKKRKKSIWQVLGLKKQKESGTK